MKFRKIALKRTIPLSIIGILLAFISISTSVFAANLARGYQTEDQGLTVGMAAVLAETSSVSQQLVERAAIASQDRFVGIVTTKDNSSLLISSKSSNVFITTSGQSEALVTDVAGEVKQGDFLTLSPLNGYLMKAESSGLKSVGLALADFESDSASPQQITNAQNSTQEVKVDSMPIEVTLAHDVSVTSANKQPFLSAFVTSLTGREVSQWKVIMALVILFVLLVTVGSIVYGAVHSTIEALGRNPLARSDIYKQLLQVVIISLVVLIFGGIVIYALLWV